MSLVWIRKTVRIGLGQPNGSYELKREASDAACDYQFASVEEMFVDFFEQDVVVTIVDTDSDQNWAWHLEGLAERGSNLVGGIDHVTNGAKRFRILDDVDRTELHARSALVLSTFLNGYHVVGPVDPDHVHEIEFSLTAVSSSIAENKNPPSPEIDKFFSCALRGRMRCPMVALRPMSVGHC